MRYLGSKRKLVDWIFSHLIKTIDSSECSKLTFLDACAGAGWVSRYATKLGFKVISNDILHFSSYIVNGSTHLPPQAYLEAQHLIKTFNELGGIPGFFYHNYSPIGERMFLTTENASKIDAIRQSLDTIKNPDLYNFLMYCLLEAMSRALNTTGIHMSFLKHWEKSAQKSVILKFEDTQYSKDTKTFSSDILSLLKNSDFRSSNKEDILYIDPPYNKREYSCYFHLFETLVKYDNPTIKGVGGIRPWQELKSDFCSSSSCFEFLKSILQETTANHILISYNSDGLLSLNQIEELLLQTFIGAKFSIHVMPYKRYKADSSSQRSYNTKILREYLFHLIKN